MTPRRLARLAATSLSLSALAIGSSGARAPGVAKVEKLLLKGDAASAVAAAEANVVAFPANSANRAQLGRAYLSAGRFASAEAAFADTLAIDPMDGASALKLALVKIALGKNAQARDVLEANRERIGGPDYGLAVALSGDVDGAVRILEAVTRAPGADMRARQNLALAYALQGKWLNARVMAVQDLSPTDADSRIISWMNFVRPATPHDQVVSLLGVTYAEADTGQPLALALAKPAAPVAVAAVAPAPTAPVMVAAIVPPPPAPVETPQTGPTIEQVATALGNAPQVMFAAMKEVVQPLPAPRPVLVRDLKPAQPFIAPAAIRAASSGRYVVQLGAFASEAMAQQAWRHSGARLGVASYSPSSARVRVRNIGFVRLSVGGFGDRASANALCGRVRHAGGTCFVRSAAGDRLASWVQDGAPRVASR